VPQRYLPSGQNSDNTISSLSWAPWRHFHPTVNCRLESVDFQRGKIRWKRMVLQCINGVSSNPIEGRTKIWQLKNLIITLFGLISRPIYYRIKHCFLGNYLWHVGYVPKSSIAFRGFFFSLKSYVYCMSIVWGSFFNSI
jgi:hypothetical protein